MNVRYIVLAFVALQTSFLFAQAPLTALDQATVIDLANTVDGVNNGPFEAPAVMGGVEPTPGQLDLDAWDYHADGSVEEVLTTPAMFPGTLPVGAGVVAGGFLVNGLNATDIGGVPALGIQPTSDEFTSGAITLKAVNNTGATIDQVAVSFMVAVLNDRDRSNGLNFCWSATNTTGSYALVPQALVVSPAALETPADWATTEVNVVLSGLAIPAGSAFYLRWMGEDISGSGQRDEFALAMVSLTPQTASAPVLMTSANILSGFEQTSGTPSVAQSITVDGSGLSDEVSVSVGAPFEVSLNEGFGYGTSVDLSTVSGSLVAVPLYVRLNATTIGAHSAQLVLSSNGTSAGVALVGTVASTGLPQLYLNELQAANAGAPLDENGDADDWFEIFNPGSSAVDLAGWYVSDDAADLTKYMFPTSATNAVVPANGWLLVWADGEPLEGALHAEFSLSSTNGESLLLVAPDGITILDQVAFGPQTSGASYGRSTDGAGTWVVFDTPTPGASNIAVGIAERSAPVTLHAWPNPADEVLHFDRPFTGRLYDARGTELAQLKKAANIPVLDLSPGIYVLRADHGAVLRFTKR